VRFMRKKGYVSIASGAPMEFTEARDSSAVRPTPERERMVRRVGDAVRNYLRTAKELLAGKYSHLGQFAPTHLAVPVSVLVACCEGGVVIRFERGTDNPRLRRAWLSGTLPEVAAALSENLVQCHPDKTFKSSVETTGTLITLATTDVKTGQTTPQLYVRLGFDAVIESPGGLHPPQKPFCLLSVSNSLEMQLMGELTPIDGKGAATPFLATVPLRLPVGWTCIEVYPGYDNHLWNANNAPSWAERDILASVAAHHHRESHLNSLDSLAAARKKFATLLESFKALLDSAPGREETLQVFLKENPVILCPGYIAVWPKLAIGAKVTDFVFRDSSSDYLLVELEKSTHRLFRKSDGHTSSQLNEARSQVTDWKRYLEDHLATVQKELGLAGISSNPRSLIVIGRSKDLDAEGRRKLSTMENENPKTRIMTYDDVHENAKAVFESLLGPLWLGHGETRIFFPQAR